MAEPKAFASLSSGLLARKGAARPAMRPQGFGQLGGTLEDLGWDDMGFEPPKPVLAAVRDDDHDAFGDSVSEGVIRHPLSGLTPLAPSPVHTQQAELADRFAGYDLEPGEEDETDPTAEMMDDEAPAPLVARMPSPANESEPAIEPDAIVAHEVEVPRRAVKPRAAPGTKAKSAFTLRLDPARHLKLRLACAINGRSAQLLLIDALDQLLAAMPELDGMAKQAPAIRKAS